MIKEIDYTQLQTYINCPRKYYNIFILQLHKATMDEGIQSRNFGSDIHTALKIWQETKDLDKGIEWFKQNYQNIEGEKIRTVDNGVKLLTEYLKWENLNFPAAKTLAIEIQDSFKIGDIEYIVKIDRIVELNDNIYIWDYKTTASMTHYFFLRFSPNFQVSGYCNYCKRKYGTCSGFIPVAMQLGWVEKPKLFTIGDKEAQIYSQVETKFSKYYKQDMQYASGFWCKFDYDIVNRTKEQLNDFELQIREWWAKLQTDRAVVYFPKNEGACMDYKGCQFRELCLSGDDETIREQLYEHKDAMEYLSKEGVSNETCIS